MDEDKAKFLKRFGFLPKIKYSEECKDQLYVKEEARSSNT